MNAISSLGNSWGNDRNFWIFLRNAWLQHKMNPPLREPVATGNIGTPQMATERAAATGGPCLGEGHIDLQA
jgi:hypothetical protein